MDSSKKKKIIVLVSIALVLIVAVSATLFVVLGRKKDSPAPPPATNTSTEVLDSYEFFTNTYNESILNRQLTTANYSGTYKLSNVLTVDFNMASDDNPKGMTDKNKYELFKNYDVSDINGFKKVLLEIRKKKNDILNLTSRLSSSGDVESQGIFTATSDSYKTCIGEFYGDEDLAVVKLSNPDKNFFIQNQVEDYFFISQNYGSMFDATIVSENIKGKASTIYVFENVYSKNNKNLRLFTVTYVYKLEIKTPNVPSDDLFFN